MGSVIGACFAKKGEIATVENVSLKTDWRQFARLLDPNIRFLKDGLIHGRRIKELLYSLIGDVEFKDLKIPFAAVAIDINTGREVIIREGLVVEAVRASISIPAIFVPVKLGGKCLVDGGIINPVPTSVAHDMGANFTIAVNVLSDPTKREIVSPSPKAETLQTPNVFSTLVQSIYIMESELIKTKIIKADIIISPDISNIEAFDFHKGKEAILAGYKAANDNLQQIQKLIKKR